MARRFHVLPKEADAAAIKAVGTTKAQPPCDHDCELEHDPRAPWGFEAIRCKKCGTKFHIPKGEAY